MIGTTAQEEAATTIAARRLTLTDEERHILAKKRWLREDHVRLADLLQPFEQAFLQYAVRNHAARYHHYAYSRAVHFCGEWMLTFDCTYWAFEWERLLEWKRAMLEREQGRSKVWHWEREDKWQLVTATLFFLGVLPYSEEIHKTYHRVLAEKWLGKERADQIADRFMTAALNAGYKDKRTLHKNVNGVLLSVLVFAKKTEIAELTKADLEGWQAHTQRSKRVARASVTRIQKILATLGYLGGESPRITSIQPTLSFGWGRTAPLVVKTFERFLADLKTIRAPATVNTYRVCLRRFGDWLAEYDPLLQSVADLRRAHIEAYKQAVKQMRCGDYTNLGHEFRTVNFGEPLSAFHRLRALSCVRRFCEHIDALEYPERPGRKLWIRGDTPRVDEQLPRMIADDEWHRLSDAAQRLTPEQAAAHKLAPFERVRAVFAVLFESGLRAGELCRLDTGCLLAANDPQSSEQTHWLRVPVGKLHNDRMIPVRPQLVKAVDEWLRAWATTISSRSAHRKDARHGFYMARATIQPTHAQPLYPTTVRARRHQRKLLQSSFPTHARCLMAQTRDAD